MLFNSSVFALFLGVVLVVYWALPSHRARNVFLLAASYLFYGWWDWRFVVLLVATSTIDYFAGIAIHDSLAPDRRKLFLLVSIGANLSALLFFKYFNFFSANVEAGLAALGVHASWPVLRVILPVGVSFYTFQAMTYTIDVYRRVMSPCRDYPDFLLFVSYFPQLVAGPISKARHLIPQLQTPRRFDPGLASEAIPYIAVGYVFKSVIADNLSGVVSGVLANVGAHSGVELVIVAYCTAFEIYGDFAGYSYIAIGVSLLFGIRLPQNFRSPYLSQSIREFWTRWHMSLTSWFREYFYFSIGGNRTSPMRRRFNVLATFVVSGLWHGANWTFVLWGALNGVGYFLRAPFRSRRGVCAVVNTFVTLNLAAAAWVFFRVRRVGDAFAVFHRIATNFWPTPSGSEPDMATLYRVYWWRLALIAGVMAVEIVQRKAQDVPQFHRWPAPARYAFYAALAMLYFYRGNFTRIPFIYFQF